MITYKDFIAHQWKSFTRQPGAGNAIIAVALRFVLLLLGGVYAVGMGWAIAYGLKQSQPQISPLSAVNNFFVFYLFVDLVLRFIFQNIPSGIITQYRLLNIPKKIITGYLLIKSLFSVPTFIGIMLWGSFAIFSHENNLLWLVMIFTFLLINSFLMILLKSSFETGIKGILLALAIGGSFVAADYFGYFSLGKCVGTFINNILQQPFLLLIPFFILYVLMVFTSRAILASMYRETTARQSQSSSTQKTAISYYSFEWKQFWRNKRFRTQFLMMVIFFPFAGLQLFINPPNNIMGTIISLFFISMILFMPLSVWMQFIFSRESVFFDKLSTIPYSWTSYLLRMIVMSTIPSLILSFLLISVSLIFSKPQILPWILCFGVFHIGISSYIFLYRSTFNSSRFDNNSSPWMNYSGVSYAPWYIETGIVAFMFIIPVIVFLISHFISNLFAQIMFFSLGIVGIILFRQGITFVYQCFLKRRYTMMEGFRAAS